MGYPYLVEDQVQLATLNRDLFVFSSKVLSMVSHLRLCALDWGELMETRKWSKLVFLMEEPAALATQMAFALRGNLLIPRSIQSIC